MSNIFAAFEFPFALEILHEAEELWQRQSGSDASSEVGSISSGSMSDGGCMTGQEMGFPSPRYVHTPSTTGRNVAMYPPSAVASANGKFVQYFSCILNKPLNLLHFNPIFFKIFYVFL